MRRIDVVLYVVYVHTRFSRPRANYLIASIMISLLCHMVAVAGNSVALLN